VAARLFSAVVLGEVVVECMLVAGMLSIAEVDMFFVMGGFGCWGEVSVRASGSNGHVELTDLVANLCKSLLMVGYVNWTCGTWM
jgi:hypothetical protein